MIQMLSEINKIAFKYMFMHLSFYSPLPTPTVSGDVS